VTTDDDNTIQQLVDRAADVLVFAPIGLFFEAPSLLPKLAQQGRVQVRNARMFGEHAVRRGEARVRRHVDDIEEHATGVLRMFGVLPEERPGAPAPAPPTGPRGDGPAGDETPVTSNGDAPAPPTAAGPSAGELAIPDYDSLSASQVVTRLDGLTPDELEAVRTYESAHRGRKTILNKVAQLQA
jgi:hypothetical protein